MLLSLPREVLEEIVLCLNYDDISKLRQVCKNLDNVAGTCLTKGFLKVQAEHAKCLKQIKSAIPRRESERRAHKLFSKHDALQGLDTRLSLLKMTYNKFIMSNQCCFIPGKVLDELFCVLHKVKSSVQITSVTNLLQEVRDISSMAMEHFDEVIAPHLNQDHTSFPSFGFATSSLHSSLKSSTSQHTTKRLESRFYSTASQRQQQIFRQKFKSLQMKVKQYHREVLLERKKRKTQKVELLRLNQMVQSLNKTVQGLMSHTSELSAQLQAFQNSMPSPPIRDVMSATDEVTSNSSRNTSQTSSSQQGKLSLNCSAPKRRRMTCSKEM